MSAPIPVVVCGQQAVILQDVKARLLPEYEMIHGILHPTPGPSPLPALLRGEVPNDPENIGTKDYSRRPAAVLLNAGYDDAAVEEVREACKGAAGGSGMVCLRFDEEKAVDVPMGPEYGAVLIERVKDVMGRLVAEGKLGVDGVYVY